MSKLNSKRLNWSAETNASSAGARARSLGAVPRYINNLPSTFQPTKRMRYRRATPIILMLLIGVSFLSSSRVGAIPEYSKDLPQALKNYCNVCHMKASGGPINDFGRDYANFGHDIEAVSKLDSDGDGYQNGEELEANTFPGDPASFPAAPKKMLDMPLIYGLVGLTLLVILIYRLRKG